jgi:hypothetical protein
MTPSFEQQVQNLVLTAVASKLDLFFIINMIKLA